MMIKEIEVYDFVPRKTKIKLYEPLTKTQLKYIEIIEEYKKEYCEIPTVRKIGSLIGNNSPATIHSMLRRLNEKGYDYKRMRY